MFGGAVLRGPSAFKARSDFFGIFFGAFRFAATNHLNVTLQAAFAPETQSSHAANKGLTSMQCDISAILSPRQSDIAAFVRCLGLLLPSAKWTAHSALGFAFAVGFRQRECGGKSNGIKGFRQREVPFEAVPGGAGSPIGSKADCALHSRAVGVKRDV